MKSHLTAFLVLFVIGCTGEPPPIPEPPRPVSFVRLETISPSGLSRLTGSAESWKREELGFEIPGRIKSVIEPGSNIVGRTFDEKGELLTEGTILATVDDERYQIALAQAKAATDVARKELEDVIPKDLDKAKQVLTLRAKDLDRFRTLVAQNSAAKRQLDEAETAEGTARADVARVEALRATKGAQIETLQAQIEQARVNIRDCDLASPFTGQIARVHVIPGGYVLPGQPVVTVQMMDPMKVEIAVSPGTDARINYNDRVRVHLPGTDEVLEGYVYLKDTFADPATRTFLVTLLVRNRRVQAGNEDERSNLPKTERLWTLQQETPGEGNYFIDVESLHEDGEGTYVWKAEGLTVDDLYGDFSPVVKVRKVRVETGEGRLPLLQVFTFRELTSLGGLDPKKDVVLGGLDEDVSDGGEVLLNRERWLLRPGDLVEVDLRGKDLPSGFYVPELAIQSDGRSYHVAVLEDGTDGEVVKHVAVEPGPVFRSLRYVEPKTSGALDTGTRIVVEGAAYVADGESVRAVEEVPLVE